MKLNLERSVIEVVKTNPELRIPDLVEKIKDKISSQIKYEILSLIDYGILSLTDEYKVNINSEYKEKPDRFTELSEYYMNTKIEPIRIYGSGKSLPDLRRR